MPVSIDTRLVMVPVLGLCPWLHCASEWDETARKRRPHRIIITDEVRPV